MAAPYLASKREENRMDMDGDHRKPNTHQPGVIFAGLRIVQNIFRQLFRLFIPTEQELIEARIYPGNPHS